MHTSQTMLAATFAKAEAYVLIINATYERGTRQKLALEAMDRRGLWLGTEQKVQAGLLRSFPRQGREDAIPVAATVDRMTAERWGRMSPAERERHRDLSGLTAQLAGYEGCRVEVVDKYDQTRRFIVGRSSGWRPCHIELKTIRSTGGMSADSEYRSVRVVERVR